MEGKQRLLQLLAFSTGPAIDVVQHYFEVKIMQQYRDFEDYLNDPQNKHKLFHEHYPKIPCCGCILISIAAPHKRGCLGNQQFAKLYDVNGTITAGHEKTMKGQISQHCICKVSAQKSVKVTDIDITLISAIIQHCCPLHITTTISRWMIDIKEVRNTFSHWGEGKLDKQQFDQNWKKLKTATLECAGDIGHTSVKMFQMAIDQIVTCSVNDLGDRILQTTKKLSEVRSVLNGVIPKVESILSENQKSFCDQISTQSKDLKTVKTVVEEGKDEIGKLKKELGTVTHRLSSIEFILGMSLKRKEECPEDFDKGDKQDNKKRKLKIDVDATSTSWDEEQTTRNLAHEIQETKNCAINDNDHSEGFQLEKAEKRCIHLEVGASPEVFQSPENLRNAIKGLIRQFVKASELDKNVAASVNIKISLRSPLTREEETVVYSVFGANNTLDGIDNDCILEIDQKPRLLIEASTSKQDKQTASTSERELLYSRSKVIQIADDVVKIERHEDNIVILSVHLENLKFILNIEGIPQSLSKSMYAEQGSYTDEITDFTVIWTWKRTQEQRQWNVVSIEDTINSRLSSLCDWFNVNYASINISGTLVLNTTTSGHTFSSLTSLELAIKSFLGKFVEVCKIQDDLEEEQLIYITVTNPIEVDKGMKEKEENKSTDIQITCDSCKKDMICLKCRSYKNLITKLNVTVQEQRDNIMRLQKQMSTFEEESDDGDNEDDATSKLDEYEDPNIDVELKKRKVTPELSEELQDEEKEFKRRKLSTETEQGLTEEVSEEIVNVIDKDRALKKLGEIPLIDLKIREGQRKPKDILSVGKSIRRAMTDYLLSNLKLERKLRTGMAKTLAKIVTKNTNKVLTSSEDKSYLEDLDFLSTSFESLICFNCGSKDSDSITFICNVCTCVLCDDCMRKHRKTYREHKFELKRCIRRGYIEEHYTNIYCAIDMKVVNGSLVTIGDDGFLRVHDIYRTEKSKLKIELDRMNSQIAIIDSDSIAITVPRKSDIHIVIISTNTITTIPAMTNMTGAIACMNSKLYVACAENIWKMNLQGDELVHINLPSVKLFHSEGEHKIYCVSSNPEKTFSYLDVTNNKDYELPEFPCHPTALTSDGFGNILYVSNHGVWQAKEDGTEYKAVLKNSLMDPVRLTCDIANSLVYVLSKSSLVYFQKI